MDEDQGREKGEKGEKGVVYIATGARFREELKVSVRSLRQVMPDIPITVFSDVDPLLDTENWKFHKIENPKFGIPDKLSNLWRTPYQSTIYLDTDTFITSSLSSVFQMLERFDICVCHETARGYYYHDQANLNLSFPPKSFAEMNAGVIAFNQNSPGGDVIRAWPTKHAEMLPAFENWGGALRATTDQPSLRQLLWDNTEVKLGILPTEYNALRYWGTYLWGEAVIVHGRGDIEKIATQMNLQPGVQRAYLQGLGTVAPFRQSTYRQIGGYFVRFHAELIMSLCHKLFK